MAPSFHPSLLSARESFAQECRITEEQSFLQSLSLDRSWIAPVFAVGKPLKGLGHSVIQDIDALRKQWCWSNSELSFLQPGLAAAVRVLDQQLSLAKKEAQRLVNEKHGRRNCDSLGCTASAYAGPPMAKHVGDVCHASVDADKNLGPQPFNITCLNFGYSGGADPAAKILALDRWRDVAVVATSLESDFLVGVACRYLDGSGPRSKHYDAVVGFAPHDTDEEVLWCSEWSWTSRVSWFVS